MSTGPTLTGSGQNYFEQRKQAEEDRWRKIAEGDPDEGRTPCPWRWKYASSRGPICCVNVMPCCLKNCGTYHMVKNFRR